MEHFFLIWCILLTTELITTMKTAHKTVLMKPIALALVLPMMELAQESLTPKNLLENKELHQLDSGLMESRMEKMVIINNAILVVSLKSSRELLMSKNVTLEFNYKKE